MMAGNSADFQMSIGPPKRQAVGFPFMPPLVTRCSLSSVREGTRHPLWSELDIATMDGVPFTGHLDDYIRGSIIAEDSGNVFDCKVFMHHPPRCQITPCFKVLAAGRRFTLKFRLLCEWYNNNTRRYTHFTTVGETETPEIEAFLATGDPDADWAGVDLEQRQSTCYSPASSFHIHFMREEGV